jgi:hypothetical protein
MEAEVLTWTRLERPPAGFAAGRVMLLVRAGQEQRYALWEGQGEPRIGQRVHVAPDGTAR